MLVLQSRTRVNIKVTLIKFYYAVFKFFFRLLTRAFLYLFDRKHSLFVPPNIP